LTLLTGTRPLELVPGKLFALGGTIQLDGRVTWVPADAHGWQPAQCYLALGGDSALLIDTGLKHHEAAVLSQLHELLPRGTRLSIFLTRSEFDCTGNFGAVLAAFEVDSLYTGGTTNPFDAFADMTAMPDAWRKKVELSRTPVGDAIPFDESGRWLVLAPALRTLATFWAYDTETRTLFSSDVFGHTTLEAADGRPVIDDPQADTVSYEQVREHLLSKFFWLRLARTRKIEADIRELFKRYPIEIIAPAHGCVLRGQAIVDRHKDMLLRCLAEVGQA
jgi:flavorubredoxin